MNKKSDKGDIIWSISTWKDANQNHNDIPLHQQDNYYQKQIKGNNFGKDMEKLEPLSTGGGNVKWYRCHER